MMWYDHLWNMIRDLDQDLDIVSARSRDHAPCHASQQTRCQRGMGKIPRITYVDQQCFSFDSGQFFFLLSDVEISECIREWNFWNGGNFCRFSTRAWSLIASKFYSVLRGTRNRVFYTSKWLWDGIFSGFQYQNPGDIGFFSKKSRRQNLKSPALRFLSSEIPKNPEV